MTTQLSGGSAVSRRRMGWILVATISATGAIFTETAAAGSFEFWDIEGTYKATIGYAAARRMEDPDDALINGAVIPLEPQVLPPGQIVGFINPGLPSTINGDDGNRNFEKGDLVNNRISLFTELQLRRENYGLVLSGDIFRDQAYLDRNANTSPETLNKTDGNTDEFSSAAEKFSGQRARLLEAYVFADWSLFDDKYFLNVRLGEHVVGWGESLFLSGLQLAMGRADAARAFVPGAEIKEILLPHNQISATLAVSPSVSLMGYRKFEFDPTEVFPVGHFFSPADVVGPGAEFAYGSINPAFVDGCPGLLDLSGQIPGIPIDLSGLCNQGGIGGVLLNAPPNILTVRLDDIEPDKDGQWGLGTSIQATEEITLGLYHIRYHSPNPTVQLNPGFAFIGSLPPGLLGLPLEIPLTTQLINQPVPVSYNIRYFGDIKMTTLSASTVIGGISVTGELSQRDGIDVQAQAVISGILTPIFTPGKVNQLLVSGLYVVNPKFLVDELNLIGEIGHFRVEDFEPIQAQPGINPVGNGDVLFTDDKSTGYQMLALGKKRNILDGWDFLTSLSYGEIVKGNPPINGAFGALYGEGESRASLSFGMQYLQNLEFGIGYNWFMGDAEARVSGSPVVPQNPFVDRDYLTFNVKYNL
jgi:hypothetical protein